ncbi:MAG: PDZ domain-containing protein [Sulfurospirillum sp.]|nr:PDZ domain-containing protein [Sulfurospirillum sp.]MBL0702775.1 PDZ domain-containing protein [Sulfurospirillum sp.]
MKSMKSIVFGSIYIIISIIFTGCATSGYKTFYKQYGTNEQLQQVKLNSNYKFLEKGEEPQVYSTNNFDIDSKKLRARGYVPIGASSFNGVYENTKNAINQAKRIGATLVLINSSYTNTETRTSTLLLPDNKTTYSSGRSNTNATYNSNNGYNGYGNANTNYYGSSTTYGTKAVPYTTNTRMYNQSAMYFIKNIKKLKFGVGCSDISREKRIELGSRGVIINLIYENTPIYNSDILEGDIVIKMNGTNIKNYQEFNKILQNFDTSKDCIWTIIRNNTKKDIKINFKKGGQTPIRE